jgi:hypothetical protein
MPSIPVTPKLDTRQVPAASGRRLFSAVEVARLPATAGSQAAALGQMTEVAEQLGETF